MTRGENDAVNLSPATRLMAQWAGYFSPAQLNPFELNPLREMRMFAHATAFAERPFIRWGRLERSDTKLLAHGPFLDLLREQGRMRGGDRLSQHASALGQRGTLDLQAGFT